MSDAGKTFTAKEFQDFCHVKGIRHYQTAIAMPRSNGKVERYNRAILDSDGYVKIEKYNKLGINLTVNKTTKTTPGEANFSMKSDKFVNHVPDSVTIDMTKLREEVVQLLEENKVKHVIC